MEKNWHLVCYDIREPKRWRRVFKLLSGRGEHLQYSIFGLRMTKRELEKLRWELAQAMDHQEDDLMIVRLCASCGERVIDTRTPNLWKEKKPKFRVL